jgi:hypothetical protein
MTSKYNTTAGVPTRGDAFSKLLWHLNEAADQAAVISHLHATEGSKMEELMAQGWKGVHEMLLLVRNTITKMAQNKFQ